MAQTFALSAISVVATAPATFDEAGWAAVIGWVLVGNVTNLGGRGDTVTPVTYEPLDQDRTRKLKGTVDGGTETYTVVDEIDDAGQLLLKAGLAAKVPYYFKEVWQDGTVEYFSGNINSFAGAGGGVNDVRTSTISVDIDSATTTVAP